MFRFRVEHAATAKLAQRQQGDISGQNGFTRVIMCDARGGGPEPMAIFLRRDANPAQESPPERGGGSETRSICNGLYRRSALFQEASREIEPGKFYKGGLAHAQFRMEQS